MSKPSIHRPAETFCRPFLFRYVEGMALTSRHLPKCSVFMGTESRRFHLAWESSTGMQPVVSVQSESLASRILLWNLFQLYMPVVDSWSLYDNSDCPAVHIASGLGGDKVVVYDEAAYQQLQEKYNKPEEGEQA